MKQKKIKKGQAKKIRGAGGLGDFKRKVKDHLGKVPDFLKMLKSLLYYRKKVLS
jgi:hypothetical protein